MEKTLNSGNGKVEQMHLNRRKFLGYSSVLIAGTALVAVGCDKDDDDDNNPAPNGAVNLGSGDIGILNYAYALEQLEAAFYTTVVANFNNSDLSVNEKNILSDIQKHEVAHREFFKSAIGSAAIPGLTVDFSSVDFTKRASILGTAKVFEDLGVAAYNGAGKLLVSGDFLTVAGKIVSVEARHAATIRHLLNPFSVDFSGSDVVDANGLDRAFTPSQVLAAADPFIVTAINASNLPTS